MERNTKIHKHHRPARDALGVPRQSAPMSCFTLKTTKMTFHPMHNTTAATLIGRILHFVGIPSSLRRPATVFVELVWVSRPVLLPPVLHRPVGS